MAKKRRYVGTDENPYLKDVEISDEAKYQIDVLVDEARTSHAGTIKSKKGAFALKREKLLHDDPDAMKPDSARFDIDIETDMNGGELTPKMLENMSYSASYRPKGKVGEQVSDITVSRLRYSALAGRKAKAPKDLSFLSDPLARDKFEQKERDGTLRRDSRRSDIPVEKRREQLIEMLPKEQQERYEDIAEQINERREKLDMAQGKIIKPREKKVNYTDVDAELLKRANVDDPTEDFRNRELRSENRADLLPEQAGMIESSRALPQFYSETRNWSKIESAQPTWSEIQQNTEIVVPAPKNSGSVNAGRFVSDDQYDPEDRYRQRDGVEPRRMPEASPDASYEALSVNPYTTDSALSPEELKKLLGTDVRRPGELSLPEGVTDPVLRSVWDGTYGARYAEPEEEEFDDIYEIPDAPRERIIGIKPLKEKHTPTPGRRVNPVSRPRPARYNERPAEDFDRGRREGERWRREEQARLAYEERIKEANRRRHDEEIRRREEYERRRRADERFAREQDEYRRRMEAGQMPRRGQEPPAPPRGYRMPPPDPRYAGRPQPPFRQPPFRQPPGRGGR